MKTDMPLNKENKPIYAPISHFLSVYLSLSISLSLLLFFSLYTHTHTHIYIYIYIHIYIYIYIFVLNKRIDTYTLVEKLIYIYIYIYMLILTIFSIQPTSCPVSWDYRIHWSHPPWVSWYMTLNNLMVRFQ